MLAEHHGYLWIQDILVVTWPQVRPLTRPSVQQVYQCKMTQSTGIATQMELEVFGAKSRGHPALKREKNNNNVESFFDYVLMSTLDVAEQRKS